MERLSAEIGREIGVYEDLSQTASARLRDAVRPSRLEIDEELRFHVEEEAFGEV